MDIKLPELSDAFKPLPRLKSLVITELENIGRKAPIDRKVFGIAFLGVFTFLVILAFAVPHFIKPAQVQPHTPVVEAPAPPPLTDVQKKAIETNDGNWNASLPPAPDKALLDEATGTPIISMDGRQSWVTYARPYDRNDERPRIVIVVAELGQNRQVSQSAIADLPGPISLAFSNLSAEPDAWIERARQSGHEVLMGVPMEPLEYPSTDPGPNTLLTHNTIEENKALLLKHMANGKGYVGLTSLSGSRMNTTPEKLKPVLQELKSRGLMWLDANLSPLSSGDALAEELKLPFTKADLQIDADMSARVITSILDTAEQNAAKAGHSVVLVQPTPLAISVLRNWAMGLPQKHLSLAPLSSLAK